MSLSSEESTQLFHDALSQPAPSSEAELLAAPSGSTQQFTQPQIQPAISEDNNAAPVILQAKVRRKPREVEEPPLDEITAALQKASISSMQDARLVLAFARDPQTDDINKNPAIIRVPQMVSGRDIFGVIQTIEDVNFIVDIQFNNPLVDSPPRIIPFRLQCYIFYIPGSDNCLLFSKISENTSIFITNLDSENEVALIKGEGHVYLRPGSWVLSLGDGQGNTSKNRLVELMVLTRRFRVSISNKRAAETDAARSGRQIKRQKLEDGMPNTGIIDQHIQGPTISSPSISSNVTSENLDLLHVRDGGVAIVQSLQTQQSYTTTETATYELQRINSVQETKQASVFVCLNSEIPGKLVAKVLPFSSAASMKFAAESWKREKEVLGKLCHPNIVPLLGYDGRTLALYEEFLPSSLAHRRKTPFNRSDTEKILADISSALAYLASKRIYHNDIKPPNIAYSPQRGAVLFDFGLATIAWQGCEPLGGSHQYLPPEYLDTPPKRGSPGDVWAFGVTMLYVLGKIQNPNRWQAWNIFKVWNTEEKDYKQMVAWLDYVREERDKLDQDDMVENLVFRMLQERALRIDAATIVETLEN